MHKVVTALAVVVGLSAPWASAGAQEAVPGGPTTVPSTSSTVPATTAGGATTPVPGGPAVDQGALDALIAARRAQVVADARVRAETARGEEAALRVDLSRTEAEVAVMVDRAEQVRVALAGARREAEAARRRQGELAVGEYRRAGTGKDALLDELAGGWRAETSVRRTYAEAAAGALAQGWREAREKVAELRTEFDEARQRLDAARGAQATAADALAAATARVGRADEGVARAEAGQGVDGIDVGDLVGDDGPTVLGPPVLTAADLARFARSRGGSHPSFDLDELAELYISEGRAEGVRGDVAFAQSVLETGNFSFRGSMVDPSDNNFAGIGACDSCKDGFGFATVQLGVRAQMQLLHAYADKDLTADKFAFPKVRTDPARLSVRGCCDTWRELTTVWATDRRYGTKILSLYNQMLAQAVQARGAGAGEQVAVTTTTVPSTVPEVAPSTGAGAVDGRRP